LPLMEIVIGSAKDLNPESLILSSFITGRISLKYKLTQYYNLSDR
jgi:hypothetical protein